MHPLGPRSRPGLALRIGNVVHDCVYLFAFGIIVICNIFLYLCRSATGRRAGRRSRLVLFRF